MMYWKILALAGMLWGGNISDDPYTPMKRIDLRISPWQTRTALIYVPEDKVPNKKYPLLICFHGKSIAGTDPAKIFREGVTRQLKEGRKIEAVNKKDGQLYKFIVVAPLAQSWSFYPLDLGPMLDDIIKRYPVDTTRIYLTGYSAGGWSVEAAKTHEAALTRRFAACVTMSPALTDSPYLKRYPLVAAANLHTWFFAGKQDEYFLNATKTYIDSTNKYKPGLTKLTLYEGKHCCWHGFYDPHYREDGMNIYEWMLQYQRKK